MGRGALPGIPIPQLGVDGENSGVSSEAYSTQLRAQSVEAITQLLARWSDGDKSALDELMPLVYNELHDLAGRYLGRERPNHTLQPTALVHEAFIRLIDQRNVSFQNRARFFGMAAKCMRNILIDHARAHRAAKRGGEQWVLSLSKADRVGVTPEVDLLALDDTLRELEIARPDHGRIVELRFFGGLTIDETAEVLGTSHATVERQWKFARAWLRHKLTK